MKYDQDISEDWEKWLAKHLFVMTAPCYQDGVLSGTVTIRAVFEQELIERLAELSRIQESKEKP